MLAFLYLACKRGFQIDSYNDEALGVMNVNESGARWVSDITLNPQIIYSGDRLPTEQDEEELHHLAHEQCFVANSIKTKVSVKTPRA